MDVDGEDPPVTEYELPPILSQKQMMELNAGAVYFDTCGEAEGEQVLTDIAADLQGVNGA